MQLTHSKGLPTPQVRNARYIGELCKFRLFPHGAAFSMVGGARLHICTSCRLLSTAAHNSPISLHR